jgi:hypothetical protein
MPHSRGMMRCRQPAANGASMKRTNLILWVLGIMLLVPQAALAQDKIYFGAAMLNTNYKTDGNDHHSTGLVGRLGYDISKHFAVETHFGGSIGPESNVSTLYGQAQIIDFYSGFLVLNGHIKKERLYALAGITYGTREVKVTNTSAATRDSDSNKSFGLGIEMYGNEDISFQLEWMRYFDNRNYQVDAWNLGLVTRF